MDKNLNEQIIGKNKIKRLRSLFGIEGEYLEEKDLAQLIIKLNLNIPTEEFKIIFDNLDTDKTGKVRVEQLIENVTKNMNSKNSYSELFKQINEELTTNSEKIIFKLKKLKEKVYFAGDTESLEEFDW